MMSSSPTIGLYQLRHMEQHDCLFLKTIRDFTATEVSEFLGSVSSLLDQHQCNRLLVDHRGTRFLADLSDIHLITKHIEQYGFSARHKMAVIYDQDRAKYEFADDVIHNWSNGIVRFFNDHDEGLAWLTADPDRIIPSPGN